MTLERSSMVWYLPATEAGLRALAEKLRQSGATRLWVKAGVDDTGLAHAWEQWTDRRCDVFAEYGIDVRAWYFVYPEQGATQWDTIARALQARPSPAIVLNAEVEWDNVPAADVAAWVAGLEGALLAHGLPVPRIGFSSVPSWDGGQYGGSSYHHFPYEAWCAACDFSLPQCYWSDPNQARYEQLRNTTGKPVIPILTACREYDDAGLLAIAKLTVDTLPALAGFSAWEAGNASFQYDALAAAYALLPPDVQAETKPPAPPAPSPFVAAYAALWR